MFDKSYLEVSKSPWRMGRNNVQSFNSLSIRSEADKGMIIVKRRGLSLLIGLGCWLVLSANVYLTFFSEYGKKPGPVSSVIIPYVILGLFSGPLSLVGVFLALKDNNGKMALDVHSIILILNSLYFAVYLVIGFILFKGGTSI
jgi:hypothetical protein